MSDARAPRVFIGLIEVAGYCSRLESGFRRAGLEATFVDLSFHPFGYSTTTGSWWLVRALAGARAHATGWARLPARALFWIGKVALFAWAVARFDTFIFSYATSFFWLRELPVLRRLGKTIIFVFHGSDCRPPYLDGLDVRSTSTIDELVALTAARKRRIRYIETYADAVVAPITCAQLLEKPFVSFLSIGIPVAAGSGEPSPKTHERGGAIRVLHAPSDPAAKGTPAIRAAIETLRRGHQIDYVEMTGRPQPDVARELAACDIVVDQVYSDTPMPTLAAEAARLAKPTVIGGYAWGETARFIDAAGMPPTLRCEPDELTAAVERLIVNPALRASLGKAASEFVATHWRADHVAARFVRLIRRTPESSWLVDPHTLRYIWGAGMSREQVEKTIAALVERHGPSALQLDDKPQLRRDAVEIAGRREHSQSQPSAVAAAR